MSHSRALAANSRKPNSAHLQAFETMHCNKQIETLDDLLASNPFLSDPPQVFERHVPGAKFINTLRPFSESGDPHGPEDVAPCEGNVQGSLLLGDESKPASAPES